MESLGQGDGLGAQPRCGLRPSHFPFSWRTRSRAWRSLETRRAFSYSAKAPAIWRIIFRVGSSLAVRSSPEAVRMGRPAADQEGDAQFLGHQLARKPAGILDNDGTHAVALDAVKE